MVQAALFDGVLFDPFTFERDDLAASEVDVGGREIVEALVVSAMIVMLDESRNLRLKNYWLYIHEYRLFDNLPEGMLIDPNYAAYYLDRSFGEPKRQPPADWPSAILALHDDTAQEHKRRRLATGLPEIEAQRLTIS